MTIIQGNLEGLRDGVYEATPEQIDLVLDESQNFGRLVDDLRLLTLAEAGQLPLEPGAGCTPTPGRRARGICLPGQRGRDHSPQDAAEPLPSLFADPQRLGQVLGNLVTNALRHTPPAARSAWVQLLYRQVGL